MMDLPRPQPIGIFPFAATGLLLPAINIGAEIVLQALLLGDTEVDLPSQWEFFRLAATGDSENAIRLLPDTDDWVANYNRFVLKPDQNLYDQLVHDLTGPQKDLLDVAAFASGVASEIKDEFQLDGELLAYGLAATAAADLEQGQHARAIQKLKQSVEAAKPRSPVFAATLLAQIAEIKQLQSDSVALVVNDYQMAIQLAAESRLPMLLPELHIKMGQVLQNAANGQRGVLLQAVNAYQFALQHGVTEDSQPELFAQLQNNLGLAYLSMPVTESSHQLRSGIAVQSFRHALKIYTIENEPEMWASINMNLANALQYAPSSHPQENLIQAVEIYEQVLQVRTKARDPVAHALVLLNQANALAHLGIFKPALEKLAEAYKLFHWYEQTEQADAAKELVEKINDCMGDQEDSIIQAEL